MFLFVRFVRDLVVEKRSTFEWSVLALAAAVLLIICGRFAAGYVHPASAWRVETEREDSVGASGPADREEWPDSLLDGEVIDLNVAGTADLVRLPGIGETRAQAIVEYRREHGPFETVDELTEVDGIGPGILEQLRPYVTVSKL